MTATLVSGQATFTIGHPDAGDYTLAVTYDAQGNLLPWVAAKVPSIADGDWKVLPDGGMEVTWKLKPNIKWHDGTPFSAEDLAFSFGVYKDAQLPSPFSPTCAARRFASANSPAARSG